MKGRWMYRGVKYGFLFIAGVFLFGFITMWLWNCLIPDIFHGPLITYWQALGLLVLSRILTKGFRPSWHGCCRNDCNAGGGGFRNHWKQRMDEKIANMTPDEREKFITKMREKCGWNYEPPQEKQI